MPKNKKKIKIIIVKGNLKMESGENGNPSMLCTNEKRPGEVEDILLRVLGREGKNGTLYLELE